LSPRINDQINSPEVFLIGLNGESLGVVSRDQAIYLAFEYNTDLIEINPKAAPPVCKLIDYGKFLYNQQKKISKQKTHSKTTSLKEIRISLNIDKHDFETKIKKAQKFIEKGNKVKVTVILKGRQNIYPQKAHEQIKNFATSLGAQLEQNPTRLGNRISAIIK